MEFQTADGHGLRRLFCANCGHVRTVPIYCKNRFCRYCSAPILRKAARRMRHLLTETKLPKYHKWYMLTLTIPNSPDLKQMAKDLREGFASLRRTRKWKENILGGFYVIEVKKGNGGWHAHIHACLARPYVSDWWPWLFSAWKQRTNSQMVHEDYIPPERVVRYVTKYMTKDEMPDEDRADANDALRYSRLVCPFGACFDVAKTFKPLKTQCPCCQESIWISEDHLGMYMARCAPV